MVYNNICSSDQQCLDIGQIQNKMHSHLEMMFYNVKNMYCLHVMAEAKARDVTC